MQKLLASADARICGIDTAEATVRCYSGAQGGVETAYSFLRFVYAMLGSLSNVQSEEVNADLDLDLVETASKTSLPVKGPDFGPLAAVVSHLIYQKGVTRGRREQRHEHVSESEKPTLRRVMGLRKIVNP